MGASFTGSGSGCTSATGSSSGSGWLIGGGIVKMLGCERKAGAAAFFCGAGIGIGRLAASMPVATTLTRIRPSRSLLKALPTMMLASVSTMSRM